MVRGIACDRGVGGVPEINALLVWMSRRSSASVADTIIRKGDVVRCIHIDALIPGIGDVETIDNNVTFCSQPESRAESSPGYSSGHGDTWISPVGDRIPGGTTICRKDRLGIRAVQNMHDLAGSC